jgi:hypothetical protein
MHKYTNLTRIVITAAILALSVPSMMAQGRGGQGQGGGRGGQGGGRGTGGRGEFDISQFMDRIMERYQETLKMSDDEWTVIKPMVQAVMEKQRAGQSSRFRGFGGGGQGGRGGQSGRTGRGGDNGRSSRGGDGNTEVDALQKVLESQSSSPTDIKSKLAAVRKARLKQAADLKKSREELRSVLTVRQEGQMVLMGLLD